MSALGVSARNYELLTHPVGAFTVVRLLGRCDPSLLGDLEKLLRGRPGPYAIDVTRLCGLSVPLAKIILEGARDDRVLVNPSEKLKALLTLVAPGRSIPTVFSEDQLGGTVEDVRARIRRFEELLSRIQDDLDTNPSWRLVDVTSHWLCPFCARIQEEILVVSSVRGNPRIAERILQHLSQRCREFAKDSGTLRSIQILEEALRQENETLQKVVTDRGALKAMVQKVEEYATGMKSAAQRHARLLADKAPQRPSCEISIIYRPAQSIGGDFYDFVDFEDERLGIIIGDVAGHGMEAGILMGMAKKILQIRLRETGSPIATLRQANRDLYPDLAHMSFISAFVGLYEPLKGVFRYARAGHNPPILYRPGDTQEFSRLQTDGAGIGFIVPEAFAVQEGEFSIKARDTLLLFTDGLEEARDPDREEFGAERICLSLRESQDYHPYVVLSTISSALDRHMENVSQDDDITAVCVKFS